MIAAGTAQLLIRSAALRRAEQDRAQLVLELVKLRAFELAGAAAELDRQRVHRAAVLRHFEMEVRAGRQARRADIADHLPAPHGLAGISGDPAHVAVTGLDPAGVEHGDEPAVATGPAR